MTYAPTSRFLPSLKTAIVGTVATIAIFSSSAFAAKKDIDAVNSALPTGVTIETATASELLDAYAAVTATGSKLKPGVVAGEILRLSTDSDIGADLAAYISATFAATRQTIAIDAVKTAGAGKTANVTNVPSFAAAIVIDQADAFVIATKAKASKTGAAAVVAGYASTLTTDADVYTLATTALTDKGLKSLPLEISAALAPLTGGFSYADAVGGVLANSKTTAALVEKVIYGAVAGAPTEAGAIVAEAFTFESPTKPGTRLLGSKAAALAKTIGATADIEQIQKVGEVIGQLISAAPISAKDKGVKLSVASTVATTLAKAIVAKPVAATGVNNNLNKVDELGELAAYLVNAVSTSTEFNLLDKKGVSKNASKAVLAIIKNIVAGAKTKKTDGSTGPLLTDVLNYVASSVALTVQSFTDSTVKTAILAALQDTKLLKPIAALAKVTADSLVSSTGAITLGLAGNAVTITGGLTWLPENGTIALVDGPGAPTGSLTDPETNSRNF